MTASAPSNENCAPPSEDCAPKKLTDSGLLECKSRPKTPKLVFTIREFVSKNCFFVIFVNLHRISFKFWDKDLFFLAFTSELVENRKNFETTTRICGNFGTKTFFFWSSLQNSWKIARTLRRQPVFVEILRRRPFFNFSCPRAPIEFT